MSTRLTNDTAIITGAGKGIGRATALAFAKAGFNLALFSRSAEDLAKVVKTIRTGVKIITYAGDVSKTSDVTAFAKRITETFGTVKILVNNAGIMTESEPVISLSEQVWKHVIDVNLHGVFLMTKHALPLIEKRGEGLIINIVSALGKKGTAGKTAYCASKFGVVGFSKALQEEVREKNIKVTLVYPGYVNTHLFSVLPKETQQLLPERTKMTQPETVAKLLATIAQQPPETIVNELDFSSWA